MKPQTLIIITAMLVLSMMSLAFALRVDDVSTNPNSIAPGQTSDVVLLIKNNGDDSVTDVSVALDFTNLPLAPYNSGSEFSISEIESDKTKQAQFEIIALNDAKSGIYKIPVKIEYKENDVAKTKQMVISIMVNSEPIIEVSVEDGLLLKGKENKVSLKIVNKGLADVKFLEILTGTSTYYNLLSQNKIYIGDVDSNDFQTVDFSLFFKDNVPSTINLPVTINYKDITNKEYSQDFVIPLKVYTTSQAQNLGLVAKSNTGYYVLGIVVIVLYIIYRLIRRRKRNSEYWEWN